MVVDILFYDSFKREIEVPSYHRSILHAYCVLSLCWEDGDASDTEPSSEEFVV